MQCLSKFNQGTVAKISVPLEFEIIGYYGKCLSFGLSVIKRSISEKVMWRYKFRFKTTNNIFLKHKREVTFTLLVLWRGYHKLTIPVAPRYEAWVCDSSLAGTAGSYPTVGMYVRMYLVIVVFSGRVDHSSRGVPPNVVCRISVIANPHKGCPWHGIGSKRSLNTLVTILQSSWQRD
jgi:hypothetical protein